MYGKTSGGGCGCGVTYHINPSQLSWATPCRSNCQQRIQHSQWNRFDTIPPVMCSKQLNTGVHQLWSATPVSKQYGKGAGQDTSTYTHIKGAYCVLRGTRAVDESPQSFRSALTHNSLQSGHAAGGCGFLRGIPCEDWFTYAYNTSCIRTGVNRRTTCDGSASISHSPPTRSPPGPVISMPALLDSDPSPIDPSPSLSPPTPYH